MPAILRPPSFAELPRGRRRDLVDDMFELYRAAGRPTLKAMGEAIANNDEMDGTASRETIRRVLSGTTVPRHWQTMEAIIVCLCQRAAIDLTQPQFPDEPESPTRREYLRGAWNAALDEEPGNSNPPSLDPWSDEQPSRTHGSVLSAHLVGASAQTRWWAGSTARRR